VIVLGPVASPDAPILEPVTGTDEEKRERQQEVTAAVLKIVGVAVAIGLVIGVGAWIMVKALGLDAPDTASPGVGQIEPRTPLPTTALPVPSGSDLPTPDNTGLVTPGATATGELYVSASPVMVKPNERINLTGTYRRGEGARLQVQRFQGGWSDFPVTVSVSGGLFNTYVYTGRSGPQRFRVLDLASGRKSNEVRVTVG